MGATKQILNPESKNDFSDEKSSFLGILPYFTGVATLGPAYFIGEYYGNPFLIFWVIYALSPMIEPLLAHDDKNDSPKKVESVQKDTRFLIPLYTYVLFDLFVVIRMIFRL